MGKKRNFTLIELLVVVAIMGILSAMLLPALSTARGKSYESSCTNNLHQIQIRMAHYQGDWEGYCPPAENVGNWENGTGWCSLLSSSKSEQTRRIFNCPADKDRMFSYSLNVAEREADRTSTSDFAAWRTSQLDKALCSGGFVLIEESDHTSFPDPGTDSDQDNFTQNANSYTPGASWHKSGVANLFLDGHVAIKKVWSVTSMTYSTTDMANWTTVHSRVGH